MNISIINNIDIMNTININRNIDNIDISSIHDIDIFDSSSLEFI